jgi:hypothetical protein
MKKNIRYLGIILFTGLMFSACNKDNKNGQDDIIGTWTTKTSTFTATVGGKPINQYFVEDMGLSASDAQLYTNLFNVTLQQNFTGTIVMKSDNTYTSNLGGQNETGTWSLSPDEKKLTIDSSNSDPIVFDVNKLTANEMQLHSQQTGTDDLNGDNTPETIMVDVNLTFNK